MVSFCPSTQTSVAETAWISFSCSLAAVAGAQPDGGGLGWWQLTSAGPCACATPVVILVADGVQYVKDGGRAGGVGVGRGVVEDQGAGLVGRGQKAGECCAQEQVDLLGGAVRQESCVSPGAARCPDPDLEANGSTRASVYRPLVTVSREEVIASASWGRWIDARCLALARGVRGSCSLAFLCSFGRCCPVVAGILGDPAFTVQGHASPRLISGVMIRQSARLPAAVLAGERSYPAKGCRTTTSCNDLPALFRRTCDFSRRPPTLAWARCLSGRTSQHRATGRAQCLPT